MNKKQMPGKWKHAAIDLVIFFANIGAIITAWRETQFFKMLPTLLDIALLAVLALALINIILRLWEKKMSATANKSQNAQEAPAATLTAISATVQYKSGQRQDATTLLLFSSALYLSLLLKMELPLQLPVVATLAGAILLLQIADMTLSYRFKYGLFGTNEYEARQIISFVLSHAKTGEFGGGLGAINMQIDTATESVLTGTAGAAEA